MKKALSLILIIICVLPLFGMTPYTSYNYGPVNNETLPMLDCVKPLRYVTGADLGAGHFDRPYDLRFGHDGLLYIADTGNNRILVTDADLNLLNIIEGFYRDNDWQTFAAPEGVFADEDGNIYIADTQNGRIVVLDPAGDLITVLDNIILTGSSLIFRPQKVVVDLAGRVYVVCSGSTEGLVQLSMEGEFIRFFGSNKVRPNPAEVIYRMFLTRAQRQAREQFIPTEFSNIHVDEAGFLYVSTRNVSSAQIRRLNALGDDILKHDGISRDVYGDLVMLPSQWNSQPQFQGVCSDADGNVYALDNTTGRVFVYDRSGQMLFMFGGKGNQVGLSTDAQAITVGSDKIYLLDAVRGGITVYGFTEYGEKILTANHLYNLGEFDASVGPWQDVIRMDAGNVMAWRALGQVYYAQRNYEDAMFYYRQGKSRMGYSMSFKEVRDLWIKRNFTRIVLIIIISVICLIIIHKRRKKRKVIEA